MASGITDRRLFTFKDLIQYIAYASLIIGFAFHYSSKQEAMGIRLEAKIDELRTYKKADDTVLAIKLANLEEAQVNNRNAITGLIYKTNRLAILAKQPELEIDLESHGN